MRLSVQGELLSTVWIVELVGRGTEARGVHTWVREAEAVNVHDALEEKQLIAEFLRGVVQSLLSGAFCGALCVALGVCHAMCAASLVLFLQLFCCVFLGSWCL
jgi:hypothetical protein